MTKNNKKGKIAILNQEVSATEQPLTLMQLTGGEGELHRAVTLYLNGSTEISFYKLQKKFCEKLKLDFQTKVFITEYQLETYQHKLISIKKGLYKCIFFHHLSYLLEDCLFKKIYTISEINANLITVYFGRVLKKFEKYAKFQESNGLSTYEGYLKCVKKYLDWDGLNFPYRITQNAKHIKEEYQKQYHVLLDSLKTLIEYAKEMVQQKEIKQKNKKISKQNISCNFLNDFQEIDRLFYQLSLVQLKFSNAEKISNDFKQWRLSKSQSENLLTIKESKIVSFTARDRLDASFKCIKKFLFKLIKHYFNDHISFEERRLIKGRPIYFNDYFLKSFCIFLTALKPQYKPSLFSSKNFKLSKAYKAFVNWVNNPASFMSRPLYKVQVSVSEPAIKKNKNKFM